MLAKASSDYTLDRALEELDSVKESTDPAEKDRLLKLAIQLLNITRYKILDTAKVLDKSNESSEQPASST